MLMKQKSHYRATGLKLRLTYMVGRNISVENQKVFEKIKKTFYLVITILMMIVTPLVIESLLCLRH